MKQFKQLIQLNVVVSAMFFLSIASMEAKSLPDENESGSSNKFAITASATSLCGAGDVTLTADVTGGTVTWRHNNRKYSTGNPITVSGTAAAGQWIAIHNTGGCDNRISNTLVLSLVPPQPSMIDGMRSTCANTANLTYSVENVSGVTYTWNVPTGNGWVITAGHGTNSITVKAGTTSGNITVTPSNSCGDGTPHSVSVLVQTPIEETIDIIADFSIPYSRVYAKTEGLRYSVAPISGTDYTWTVSADWKINSDNTKSSIIVTSGTQTAMITVKAKNACGEYTDSKYYQVNPLRIDACVNTMYEFQYQTLDVFAEQRPGEPDTAQWQWQWYAKRRGEADSEYKIIANSFSHKIKANYVRDVFRPILNENSTDYNDSIVFTVKCRNIENTSLVISTDTLDMEFIVTNGTDFVELNANYNKTGASSPGIGLKIHYLNLGVERDEDGTQNACDFGSFFQWGRVADGHEKAKFTKNLSNSSSLRYLQNEYSNNFVSCTTIVDPATTFNNSPTTPNLEGGPTTWQVVEGDPAYGKVIAYNSSTCPNSWNTPKQFQYYFWATSTYAKTSNDPCPPGWHVPTIYELGALFKGTPDNDDNYRNSTENTWYRRPHISQRIVGGYIVSFGDGSDNTKRVFLPAVHSGGLGGNPYGNFYSSTSGGNITVAASMILRPSSSTVYITPATSGVGKVVPCSVRCVKE